MSQKKYDSTVARIAGNIASGLAETLLKKGRSLTDEAVAIDCVSLARAIIAEVERTEAKSEGNNQ